MFKTFSSAALAALLAFACAAATAQEQEADPAEIARQFNASLHYQSGDVAVAGAHATLHLDGGFRYLAPADTRRVLEELWGNPPDADVLGMLVPGGIEITDDDSWAVVLSYSDDGFVSDEEAAKIDYSEMLKTMQEETAAANDEREQAGYGRVELVGWASPPRYDAEQKKLHWAKELSFSGADAHTVNYDIRALGRGGYLSMNAVGGMGDLANIQQGMQRVLHMVEFDSGHRYADFNEGTDKVAGYGLAALVAGAAATKMGLFAKLGVLLLSLKKFAVLLLVGAAALLKKLFGKKDQQTG
ncbi:MAG: DUF2167 domain-containing protein [Xanthomonadales bacterium]|nr:DUF2167 domain-containing protein [Xanthomonadales bacterium]